MHLSSRMRHAQQLVDLSDQIVEAVPLRVELPVVVAVELREEILKRLGELRALAANQDSDSIYVLDTASGASRLAVSCPTPVCLAVA